MERSRRRKRVELFQPSPGARLTYRDLLTSPPRQPPEERFEPPIHRAVTYPSNVRLVCPPGENPNEIPPIYLMRQFGAEEAYALVGKEPIRIKGHGGWGEIIFAVIYPRVNDVTSNTFHVPNGKHAKLVAIKKLIRARVLENLRQGGEENPYKEISRMMELGDNVHVLRCIDALEDDEYLYIITPKASDEGTLVDAIFSANEAMDTSRARSIFLKILKILSYLEEHGICHRDFTPDNFLFLTRDNLVVFDLAMSHRLPVNEQGRRVLSTPRGNFGTYSYMPPEVFNDRVFDGVHVDLWAAAVILYNLLTNHILYRLPVPSDISFRYNILARGLSSTPLNERTAEVLQSISGLPNGDAFLQELLSRAIAHLNLSPEATELLEKLLSFDVTERWCLAQAMESTYVQSGD